MYITVKLDTNKIRVFFTQLDTDTNEESILEGTLKKHGITNINEVITGGGYSLPDFNMAYRLEKSKTTGTSLIFETWIPLQKCFDTEDLSNAIDQLASPLNLPANSAYNDEPAKISSLKSRVYVTVLDDIEASPEIAKKIIEELEDITRKAGNLTGPIPSKVIPSVKAPPAASHIPGVTIFGGNGEETNSGPISAASCNPSLCI